MLITCPSGLTFNARRWTLGDPASLLGAKDKDVGSLPKYMVALAAETVVDPGPYKMKAGEKVNTDEMSSSDIAVANIMIKAYGDSRVTLKPNCGACRKLLKDFIDIDVLDFPVFMASPEGVQHLSTGTPVVLELAGGVSVKLRSVRGRDLQLLGALQSQEEDFLIEINQCFPIVEVSDPRLKEPLTDLPAIRQYWRKADGTAFGKPVEDKVDELFGGVDTSYNFTCDHLACRTEQVQTLPLDLTFYGFDPLERQRRRASTSSAKSLRDLMPKASTPSLPDSPKPQDSTYPSPK